MERSQLLFGYESITRLTLIILGITFTYYLWQIKDKSRATWLLIASFICMTIAFVGLLSPIWTNIAEPGLVIFVIISMSLLIRFGYDFPQHDQPRESRVTSLLSLCLCLGALGLGIYYNYLLFVTPSAIDTIFTVNGLLYLLLLINILLTMALLLRQTIHRIAVMMPPQEGRLKRMWRVLTMLVVPPTNNIRILRNFAAGVSLALVPGLAEPLYQTGLLPIEVAIYMVDLGLLLMFFTFFITYLNGTHESVSFTLRLISVPLVTLLIILGVVGMITGRQFNQQSEHERQVQVLLAYKGIRDSDLSVLSEHISYITAKEPDEEGRDTPYRVLFARPVDFSVEFLHAEDLFRRASPELFVPDISVSAADEFTQATSLRLESILRYDGVPSVDLPKYLSYLFTYNHINYEVGFNLYAHKESIHDIAVGLMILEILGSLFILLVFPRFFRKTLINPLNALLQGIKLANTTEQTAVIPVQYEDEIGFLTHSFNDMMASIRQSAEALRQINAELESRVDRRTAELSQSNVQLQQEVAERERAEAELLATNQQIAQQNAQLQQLNATKDKYFSIIAHDLQTPITRVLELIRFIPENIEYLGAEELKETAETLNNSLENFYELLQNLFTWSGIQRGTMTLSPKVINLTDIVARNLTFFIPAAEEKQVRIKNLISVDTHGYADPDMVYAVVRNLISNALKYTFPGDHVEVSAIQRDDSIEFAVADTGVGISAENLAKLFHEESGYQTPGTSGEEGTGLGLLLCKEMIEQNGGKMWIESILDEGTTCRFTLPQQLEKTSPRGERKHTLESKP